MMVAYLMRVYIVMGLACKLLTCYVDIVFIEACFA